MKRWDHSVVIASQKGVKIWFAGELNNWPRITGEFFHTKLIRKKETKRKQVVDDSHELWERERERVK